MIAWSTGDRPSEFVQPGLQLADLLHRIPELYFAPSVACEQRFRFLHQLVGDGVDRAGQPTQEAGDVAVTRIDIRRDLLQEHNEQALEPDEFRDRVAEDG